MSAALLLAVVLVAAAALVGIAALVTLVVLLIRSAKGEPSQPTPADTRYPDSA